LLRRSVDRAQDGPGFVEGFDKQTAAPRTGPVVEGDFTVTRELKLALIVGFSLVLAVTVLISDHLSKARQVKLAEVSSAQPAMTVAMVAEPPVGALPSTEEPPVPMPPKAEPSTNEITKATLTESKSEVVHLTQGKGASGRSVTEPKSDARDAKPDAKKDTRLALDRPAPANLAPVNPDADLIKAVTNLGHSVRKNGDSTEIVLKPAQANAKPASPATSAPLPGEKTYVVVDGDNFTKVARKLYGDGNLWKKLADANSDRVKGDVLRVGMKLRAPAVETLTGKAASTSLASKPASTTVKTVSADKPSADKAGLKPADKNAKKGDKTSEKNVEKSKTKKPDTSEVKYASYTVKKGDTLGTIAQRTLGSSTRADELVKVNSSLLEDETNIPIGAVIKVPQS